MPFITEEIWQRVAPLVGDTVIDKTKTTIMLQQYPEFNESHLDTNAIEEVEWIKQFILGIRKIRGEMNIAPGKPLPVLLQNGSEQDKQRVDQHELLISTLAKTESIQWLESDNAPESAIALVGSMRILIPMAGLIDKEAEISRLTKNIEKMQQEVKRGEAKLKNSNFVDRAPPQVVAKEQQKVDDARAAVSDLEIQLEKISKL
jgi:valyl-tRNA synthetase